MASLKILPVHEALTLGNGSSKSTGGFKTSIGDYIRHSLVTVFARTFFNEEVLGRAAGVEYRDLMEFCTVYVEIALKERMSYLAIDKLTHNCVAFLMVEDVAGPNPEVLKSGMLEKLEKSTSASLGKVFHCLESLHELFKQKIGVNYRNPLKRGNYFHILAAGTIPEVRGTGVVMAMVAKMYMNMVDRAEGGYSGMITEATSFASQRILARTLLPEFGWVVKKPISDFKNEDGTLTFPTVQTPTVNLSYQFAASHGSLERKFQEALMYIGSDRSLLEGIPHVALRLHALHTVAVQGQARGKEARPSFLSPVARAKFNAVKALRNEGKELGEIRQELVDIVQHNFPEWRQALRNITSVPIDARTRNRLMSSLMRMMAPKNLMAINIRAIWVPDKFADECMRCEDTRFSALSSRKHHCRVCGLVVCSSCTPRKLPLPPHFRVGGLHRVCLTCTDATLKE